MVIKRGHGRPPENSGKKTGGASMAPTNHHQIPCLALSCQIKKLFSVRWAQKPRSVFKRGYGRPRKNSSEKTGANIALVNHHEILCLGPDSWIEKPFLEQWPKKPRSIFSRSVKRYVSCSSSPPLLSWFHSERIEIPGPIPNLDDLTKDPSLFVDFFRDVPEI